MVCMMVMDVEKETLTEIEQIASKTTKEMKV